VHRYVKCPQCGGYVRRGVDGCPACGYFLPGHMLIRGLVVLLALGSAVFVAVTVMSWVWPHALRFFGDVAEHDARIEHRVEMGRKEQEASAKRRAKQEVREKLRPPPSDLD